MLKTRYGGKLISSSYHVNHCQIVDVALMVQLIIRFHNLYSLCHLLILTIIFEIGSLCSTNKSMKGFSEHLFSLLTLLEWSFVLYNKSFTLLIHKVHFFLHLSKLLNTCFRLFMYLLWRAFLVGSSYLLCNFKLPLPRLCISCHKTSSLMTYFWTSIFFVCIIKRHLASLFASLSLHLWVFPVL